MVSNHSMFKIMKQHKLLAIICSIMTKYMFTKMNSCLPTVISMLFLVMTCMPVYSDDLGFFFTMPMYSDDLVLFDPVLV